MSARPDELARLDALAEVALRVATTARSGRVALAQFHAALDPAWLSAPRSHRLRETLEAATTAALEPLPFAQVERALKAAWGVPASEELDELETEPLALTPTSQVHRGRLAGADVAVKVVRPALEATVRQDVTLLEALAAPLSSAFPALAVSAILAELRERVLEQFDLEHEAMLMRRFHRALRGHPDLYVPAPVTRLSHDEVLVSELVEGSPLLDATDPDRAAAGLVRFVFGAGHFGVAYADPEPANFIVTEDGRLAIVDFGSCREVDRERLAAATRALDALIARDAGALAEQLERLGWLPASEANLALELAHAVLGEHLEPGPSHLDSGAARAVAARARAHTPELARLLPRATLAPVDLWPARGLLQVFGTIVRLGATGDWPALALSALRDGWGPLRRS